MVGETIQWTMALALVLHFGTEHTVTALWGSLRRSYVARWDGTVQCVELSTGQVAWSRRPTYAAEDAITTVSVHGKRGGTVYPVQGGDDEAILETWALEDGCTRSVIRVPLGAATLACCQSGVYVVGGWYAEHGRIAVITDDIVTCVRDIEATSMVSASAILENPKKVLLGTETGTLLELMLGADEPCITAEWQLPNGSGRIERIAVASGGEMCAVGTSKGHTWIVDISCDGITRVAGECVPANPSLAWCRHGLVVACKGVLRILDRGGANVLHTEVWPATHISAVCICEDASTLVVGDALGDLHMSSICDDKPLLGSPGRVRIATAATRPVANSMSAPSDR